MIEVEIKLDVDGLLIKLDELNKAPIEGINFGRLGVKAVELINERTEKGRDIHNKPFVKYSDSYRERKKQRSGDFFNGNVDLTRSGNMLGAITSKSNKNSSTVFFSDSVNSEKARGHNDGIGRLPQREFFGLSDSDIFTLEGLAEDDIVSYLKSV